VKSREIFDQVSDMQGQVGQLYDELGDLKNRISDLLEENHRLKMENYNLRNHFDQMSETEEESDNKTKTKGSRKIPSEGYDNLARLYEEGFHICNLEFGSPRQNEDCIFCLEFFNKKR